MKEDKIQKILNNLVDNKKIFGTVIRVANFENEIFSGSSGNLNEDSQYFIASTTKLYTTAMIMKLRYEGKLSLDDTLDKFFSSEIIKGLNNFQGGDYSNQVTVRHLISQTSGIPDYFEGKGPDGKSLVDKLILGQDQSWTFERSLEIAKEQKSKFKPGQPGKALYSDTNFQLLGRIIEILFNDTVENVFEKNIYTPLQLNKTYMYSNIEDRNPQNMYYKDRPFYIPQAMISVRADGGIVSTSDDSMKFIKAFFSGTFFPVEYFEEMRAEYRGVMFPLQYGIGIMRFKLPRYFTLFTEMPELIGHSGLSGAFEYYCPDKKIFITGTVNQIANPSLSYRMLVQILNLLLK
ncbi:MAG: serine hydrolase domain-containing protein [bacterium]